MTDEREALYWRLHDALPLGWHLTPADYHGEERRWHVTAVDLRQRGRRAKRESVAGIGPTELEAVRDLTAKLGARPSA